MAFKEVAIASVELNPFEKFGSEWALVTAGDEQGFNTMTIGWGALGVVWGKNAMTVYIRPQRYTKQFVDAADRFTVSFFPPSYRRALGLLGSRSGRDGDKVAEAGLNPAYLDGTTSFEEASLVFVCRKLYAAELEHECFTDAAVDEKVYPERDYHTMYIGEIEHVYVTA